MERVEEQHLRNIVNIGIQQNPSRNENQLRYFLATVLLRHFLGTGWSDQCVKPSASNMSRIGRTGRSFLRTDNDDVNDNLRHQIRIERLAEMLFQLQDVPGIESRRASIQQ